MKLSYYQFVSGFQLLFLTAFVWANNIEFGQKLNEADWTVVSETKSCMMRQLIPLYGKAEFEQKFRDKDLYFNIYTISVPEQKVIAKITSIPPKWNHVTVRRPIGKVTLQTSNKVLSLEHKLSMRVKSELQDGMFPTLTYKSWTNEEIHVSISPINFRERLPQFLTCVANLPLQPVVVVKPKSKPKVKPKPKPIKITKIVDDADPNTVTFGENSATLDSKAKYKLKKLVNKIKKDKNKKHIIVSGYSDNTGNKTISTAISKQRAINVQHFLEKQGLPAKYIFTRYFGRDHAILSNKTAIGRAKNRRVHVDVIHSNLKAER